MKIQGSGGPPRAPSVSGTDAASSASGVDPSRETQPAAAVRPAAQPDTIAEVASALRAGTLSPQQALDELVRSAIGTVGGNLPDSARAELKKRLEALLAEDPYLTDKTRRIGVVPHSPETPPDE